MPEDQPTYRQRLIEGITARFPLHRHSDGEEFELTIESVTETEGNPQLRLSVVDRYAMVYEVDTIEGPQVLEIVEGEEVVFSDEGDESEEKHRLVSPKIAAIVGGATLAGVSAIAVSYFYNKQKKK